MSSLNSRKVFEQYMNVAYGVCGKWVPKLLAERGRYESRQQIEELVQDAACRALDGFLKRCDKRGLPAENQRRNWVAQSAFFAAKTVTIGGVKTTFGHPSPKGGYIDAMNRRGPMRGIGLHGTDEERELPCREEYQEPTHAELRSCIAKQGFPRDLGKVAEYLVFGIGRNDIAVLLGVSPSRVDQKIRAVKDWLLAVNVQGAYE